MEKIARSKIDLDKQYNDQLSLLEVSCKSYDDGIIAEAKRIALQIRILFHDSRNSHSLISQVGMQNKLILSTCLPVIEGNMLSHSGLILRNISGSNVWLSPRYDEDGPHKYLTMNEWWNEVVFQADNMKLSRKDLVTIVANQDGGAHVDPNLNSEYYSLSRENALQWNAFINGKWSEVENPTNPALRQIGHEVLISLKEGYRLRLPEAEQSIFSISAISIVEGVHTKPVLNIGRNKPCPCGSGLKYKRCHYSA